MRRLAWAAILGDGRPAREEFGGGGSDDGRDIGGGGDFTELGANEQPDERHRDFGGRARILKDGHADARAQGPGRVSDDLAEDIGVRGAARDEAENVVLGDAGIGEEVSNDLGVRVAEEFL